MQRYADISHANEALVSEAFSAQAPVFDETQKSNQVLIWMRNRIYRHLDEYLHSADTILELNAGTGIDAIHLARRGHRIVAVDNAAGMVKEIRKKAKIHGMTKKITAYQCSFTELHTVPVQSFDVIYSNFGGLNCVPDLSAVVQQLKPYLKKGTLLFFAIMPPVCPWELLYALRGNWRFALRRLQKDGTASRIEGRHFLSWYFTPQQVVRAFGVDFTLVSLRGIASLTPPPYMVRFQKRFPRIVRTLMKMDEIVSAVPPFNRWADYFIISLRFDPQVRRP